VAEAFFEQTEDGLRPVPEARSPWSPDMLHGRLLAGLAARASEPEIPGEFRLVRLTLDMFRFPPMLPFQVTATVTRAGRRVRVLEVSIRCEGTEVARASSVALRTGAHPDASLWSPPEWEVPPPDAVAPPKEIFAGWEFRPITPDAFSSAGRKQVWMRDNWQLVSGEPLSGNVRVALAADLPNPLANAGTGGLQFINADLTLTIRRSPVTEWIGVEVANHLGEEGIAIGLCTMYDTSGAIGWFSVGAVAND
jgi:hypothetical protein